MDDLVRKMFNNGAVHHGYLIESREANAHLELAECISALTHIQSKGNPDFVVTHYEQFGIEDARALQERMERKAVVGSRRFFVLSISTITSVAEHALLKTLEEPPEGTHLFLVLPSRDAIIPTLRSRLVYAGRLDSEASPEQGTQASDFLKADLKSRLVSADEIAKLERPDVGRFLDRVIRVVASQGGKQKSISYSRVLGDLLKARTMISEGGVGTKQVLQYVALTLPRRLDGASSSSRPRQSHGTIVA